MAMRDSANALAKQSFGISSLWVLTLLFGTLATWLAVIGPVSFCAGSSALGVSVCCCGVLLADHFILCRRKLDSDGVGAFHVPGFIAGACGIAAYQALSRLAPTVGATLPAFLVSAEVYLGPRFARRMPLRR